MTDEDKLYQAYYQPDHLWTGGTAIKELRKIMSMSQKDIKSWLSKQALWQIHIPPPKEIHHLHYHVTKLNENTSLICLICPINVLKEMHTNIS